VESRGGRVEPAGIEVVVMRPDDASAASVPEALPGTVCMAYGVVSVQGLIALAAHRGRRVAAHCAANEHQWRFCIRLTDSFLRDRCRILRRRAWDPPIFPVRL
jgi:hypothetical protein